MDLIIYLIPVWVYGALEISFGVCHRVASSRRKIDLTFYVVTVPAMLMILVPILFVLGRGYHPSPDSIVSFIPLYFIGVAVRVAGLRELGSFFSAGIETRRSQHVIDSGIYRHVRHPLYLGTILMSVATIFYCVNLWSVALMIALLTGIAMRIRKEEDFLRRNLAGYGAYMQRTKRLVPGIY